MNVALQIDKHGRRVTIAKIVKAGGRAILAMPYRNRRFSTPSLPPSALQFARQHGAVDWVVRFDTEGRCYSLPLADVERVGERRADNEIYVDLRHFKRCPWLDWPWVDRAVLLPAAAEAEAES